MLGLDATVLVEKLTFNGQWSECPFLDKSRDEFTALKIINSEFIIGRLSRSVRQKLMLFNINNLFLNYS